MFFRPIFNSSNGFRVTLALHNVCVHSVSQALALVPCTCNQFIQPMRSGLSFNFKPLLPNWRSKQPAQQKLGQGPGRGSPLPAIFLQF